MNTFQTMAGNDGEHLGHDGASVSGLTFAASKLPVIGGHAHATKAAGIALAFATEAAERCGADRFALLLVDADGATLSRLGPFCEDDVVAIWRDLAARTGLPRMIVREDGILGTVAAQVGRLMLGKTRIRRRHGSLGNRRPRFLVRRKTGRLPVRPQIHRGENEIIARS